MIIFCDAVLPFLIIIVIFLRKKKKKENANAFPGAIEYYLIPFNSLMRQQRRSRQNREGENQVEQKFVTEKKCFRKKVKKLG